MKSFVERVQWAARVGESSAREVCRLAGLSATYLSRVDAEDSDPRSSVTVAIGEVLGVSLDWLCAGNGKEPTPKQIKASIERARRNPRTTKVA